MLFLPHMQVPLGVERLSKTKNIVFVDSFQNSIHCQLLTNGRSILFLWAWRCDMWERDSIGRDNRLSFSWWIITSIHCVLFVIGRRAIGSRSEWIYALPSATIIAMWNFKWTSCSSPYVMSICRSYHDISYTFHWVWPSSCTILESDYLSG